MNLSGDHTLAPLRSLFGKASEVESIDANLPGARIGIVREQHCLYGHQHGADAERRCEMGAE